MIGFDSIAFQWMAKYKDGTVLKQFEDSGKEHLFSEVNHSQLIQFGWIPQKHGINPISIKINSGQKLKAYRKNFVSFISGKQTIVFVLGIEGQNLIYIFQDEIVIGDENLV